MQEGNGISPGETLTFVVSIDSDDEADSGEKGIFRRLEDQQSSLRDIPLTVLQENLIQTIGGLRKLFKIDEPHESKLPLKQVQVSFEITASGKVALLGTSAALAGRGAIVLTFGT
jgi:hypothetical protein